MWPVEHRSLFRWAFAGPPSLGWWILKGQQAVDTPARFLWCVYICVLVCVYVYVYVFIRVQLSATTWYFCSWGQGVWVCRLWILWLMVQGRRKRQMRKRGNILLYLTRTKLIFLMVLPPEMPLCLLHPGKRSNKYLLTELMMGRCASLQFLENTEGLWEKAGGCKHVFVWGSRTGGAKISFLWAFATFEGFQSFIQASLIRHTEIEKVIWRDFPGVPVVKNLPCNAGDMSLIPGWGTKIPHGAEQLSPSTATAEPVPWLERVHALPGKIQVTQQRSWVLQVRPDTTK